MYKIYFILMILLSNMIFAGGTKSFIVLTHDNNQERIEQKKHEYENIIQSDSTIQSLLNKEKVQAEIQKFKSSYILKVGPFEQNDLLAIVYLTVKQSFGKAFIVEEKKPVSEARPIIKTIEKKVYIDKEVIVEKEDETMWIALFGLALIGILFMFLSSDQIKRLKQEHEKIKSKHKNLEQKQHEVLSSMGENIHTIAREAMGHTHRLAEKVKETPLHADMEKVIYNEHELLDVTGDLIKFLRLKSKKVVIQNEIFNFNHVLNEVAGLLNNTYKQNDIELIFDIDKDVPRYMLADSLHLGQILINLLEYFIQNSMSKEIQLEVLALSSLTEGMKIKFQINSDITIDNQEKLFDSYYDEASRKYIGLGLFVAKELTHLMDGELSIQDHNGQNSLIITIPVEEKNKEKRKYRLPDKGLVGKKILIIDSSYTSALATEKLFAYFRAETKILSVEELAEHMPNPAFYDIIALGNDLFNARIIKILKDVREVQDLKVISLENLFASGEVTVNPVIDISLQKPLTQEYVFDTLVELYEEKRSINTTDTKESDATALPVIREVFKNAKNVTVESFSHFSGSHVLIVEDNIINQKVVLSVLGKSEMKLSVANNGQEALDFLHNTEEQPDFILMDINMPVMDGYRSAELIREDKRFDEIAIVSLTALISEHEIQKVFDSGMNGYLSKPLRIEKLYSALSAFLDKDTPLVSEIETMDVTSLKLYGLDVEAGIKHMKNNTIFYKEVLKEFVDAYAHSDTFFEKLVDEQRFEQVKMLCLDMKGLTGSIGAKELQLLINEIYQQLIYKKPELLHVYVKRYKIELTKLNKSIGIYLAS